MDAGGRAIPGVIAEDEAEERPMDRHRVEHYAGGHDAYYGFQAIGG
jgi:hypothetical protein